MFLISGCGDLLLKNVTKTKGPNVFYHIFEPTESMVICVSEFQCLFVISSIYKKQITVNWTFLRY